MSRTYLELDYRQLRQNIRHLQQRLPSGVQIMGVVKDNGYGTDALTLARALIAEGVHFLAVSTVAEALTLRSLSETVEILILGYFELEKLPQLIASRIAVTIFDVATALNVHQRLQALSATLVVHLKIDTGMGRLGFWYTDHQQSLSEINTVLNLSTLQVVGIYSHFAVADSLEPEMMAFTKQQIQLYDQLLSRLQVEIPYTHLSNSYGFLNYPHLPYSFVRLGILLLGCTSRDDIVHLGDSNLVRPVVTWKSRIIAIKDYSPGSCVSYGCSYRTTDNERIAVVSVGYGDGYDRRLSNQFSVIIHDTLVPIVGRVCMDQMMVRVNDLACAVGDEVILIGASASVEITVDQMARTLGTINNEIFCKVAARVPRKVIND